MNNTQYYHGTIDKGAYQEYTVALEVPSKSELIDFVSAAINSPNATLKLKAGKTHVSPHDVYNKHLGRRLANERMQELDFELCNIYMNGDRTQLVLANETKFVVQLEIKHGRKRVYFTLANVGK